jgi:F0F1-type ATP synthase assembly protein I
MAKLKRTIGIKATKAAARHSAHGMSTKAQRKPLRSTSLLSAGVAVGLGVGWAVGRATAGQSSASSA